MKLIVIITILLLIPIASAANLYVDIEHASCSDAYTHTQAQSEATPWCGLTSTTMAKIEDSDTVIMKEGRYYYSGRLKITGFDGDVTIMANPGDNVVLTRGQPGFYDTTTTWTLNATTANYKLWEAPVISSDTCMAGMYYDSKKSLFPACSSWKVEEGGSNMDWTWFTTYSTTASIGHTYDSLWHDNANNKIYLRTNNLSMNPNDVSMIIGDADIAESATIFRPQVDGSAGWTTIKGFTVETLGSFVYVPTGDGASKFSFENNTIYGGSLYGIFYLDGAGSINETNITNNQGIRLKNDDWSWTNEHEVAAAFVELYKAGDNMKITDNIVSGYFDGVTHYSGSTVNSYGNQLEIARNDFQNIYDDCFEIEDWAYCVNIHHNNCTNSHNVLTLTPSNSSACQSQFVYNIGMATLDTTGTERVFKVNNGAVGETSNWNISYNTLSGNNGIVQRTDAMSAGRFTDMTFTNNIFYGTNSELLFMFTGTPELGNFYDYNLYYKTDGNAFAYYSSDTSSTEYLDLDTAKESPNWDGTWDVNGDWGNPLLTNYVPAYNSPACSMSSTGSYVGAVPCQLTPSTCDEKRGIVCNLIGCYYELTECTEATGLRAWGTVCNLAGCS